MLVDEVEVEESVDISHRGDVAHRVTRARITQAGKDMPRRRNGDEEQKAGAQAELSPAPPIAGQSEVRPGCEKEEDGSHQTLGQHGQRQCGPGQVKTSRLLVFQRNEKMVE